MNTSSCYKTVYANFSVPESHVPFTWVAKHNRQNAGNRSGATTCRTKAFSEVALHAEHKAVVIRVECSEGTM